MNPAILLKFGALGVAGYAAYRLLEKRQPKPSDYQTAPGANGTTVATPVAPTITEAQATGSISIPIPMGPMVMSAAPVPDYSPVSVAPQAVPPPIPAVTPATPVPVATAPVPIPVPVSTNEGTVYAPPNTVQVTPSGDVTQPAPIVVTPAGSSSIAVGNTLDVQRALNTLGYLPKLDEDGKLGPKTVANIKAFQSKSHLTVDGIAGPATKVALSAALALLAGAGSLAGATAQFSAPQTGVATTPMGGVVDTTIALGWTPKQVQHALNVLGTRPKLAEDGQTGPKTVAAIKSFQTANGLTPDGVAGPKTKTALYLAMSQIHPTGA